jgi:hypothetical protein
MGGYRTPCNDDIQAQHQAKSVRARDGRSALSSFIRAGESSARRYGRYEVFCGDPDSPRCVGPGFSIICMSADYLANYNVKYSGLMSTKGKYFRSKRIGKRCIRTRQ